MTWLMKFNPNKCCVMTTISLATKYKILHDYILHDTLLPVVNQLKYVVILQNNLKWDKHVSVCGCFKRKPNFWIFKKKLQESSANYVLES